MKKSPLGEPKKKPQQERSRVTVDFILEAAARILNRDGTERLNTNRIAETAGVAVASLYQYFPNKEAIVSKLLEMHLAEEFAEFTKTVARLKDGSIREAIRVAVQSTIDVHAGKPGLVKSILESIPLLGKAEALIGARRQVIELVAETLRRRRADIRSPKDFDIKAFIVVQAAEAVIHAAANERPEYLTNPAFAGSLVEMLDRFLLED